MTLGRAAPIGVWRGTGARVERGRVACGESPGIRRGAGPGGTRTDRHVFFGLLSRRTRGSRGSRPTQPAIIPMRHPIARSVNTRLSNKRLAIRAVLLFATVAAAGAGVETTGVGVVCCGSASAAAGAPQSAQHTYSTCSEVCDGRVHRNGVRMIHFPVRPDLVCPESAQVLRTDGHRRMQAFLRSVSRARNGLRGYSPNRHSMVTNTERPGASNRAG
jgi:hypothetical protein